MEENANGDGFFLFKKRAHAKDDELFGWTWSTMSSCEPDHQRDANGADGWQQGSRTTRPVSLAGRDYLGWIDFYFIIYFYLPFYLERIEMEVEFL